MSNYLLLFIAGITGGFASGLLGIGGGIIFIFVFPIILSAMCIPDSQIVQFTIANSLLATFFSAISGLFVHVRHKNFHPKKVGQLALFSLPATFLTLTFIVNTSFYTILPFNFIVILLLGYMLVRNLKKDRDSPLVKARYNTKEESMAPAMKINWYAVTGLTQGILSPLSGLGGGAIVVPLLYHFKKESLYVANSISLGLIALTSLGASILNVFEQAYVVENQMQAGYLLPLLDVPMLVGVFIASPLGAYLAKKLRPSLIKATFSAFLLAVLLKKAWELIAQLMY